MLAEIMPVCPVCKIGKIKCDKASRNSLRNTIRLYLHCDCGYENEVNAKIGTKMSKENLAKSIQEQIADSV